MKYRPNIIAVVRRHDDCRLLPDEIVRTTIYCVQFRINRIKIQLFWSFRQTLITYETLEEFIFWPPLRELVQLPRSSKSVVWLSAIITRHLFMFPRHLFILPEHRVTVDTYSNHIWSQDTPITHNCSWSGIFLSMESSSCHNHSLLRYIDVI